MLATRQVPRKKRMLPALICGTALALASPALAETTLTAVPHSDLRIIDPYKGTDSSVAHAQMIFDTLFAMDAEGQPQPQMVGEYSVSDDTTEYTFTLRDGLAFSDGSPVTSEDVIASVKRWAVLASPGASSPINPDGYEAIDDTTFVIRLTEPFALLPDALGSPFAPAFIMRAEDLEIPEDASIESFIGSGPFIFEVDEWTPGASAVYSKNEAYIPRDELASGFAGGRVVNFDRVVWTSIGDMTTALAALEAGEVDMIETVVGEDLIRGRDIENVAEAGTEDRGVQHMVVINHTVPPFDTPEGRQALLQLIDPTQVMLGSAGDPDLFEVCRSWYICGSQFAEPANIDGLDDTPDPDRARELLDAAGYDGEPITILMASDRTAFFNGSQVIAAQLQSVPEINVDPAVMDWGALTTRRASRDMPGDGGWSLFMTSGTTASQVNPLFHFNARMCDAAWFGWPCNEETEAMRLSWASIDDPDARRAAALELQDRWATDLPFIPFGTVANRSLYRADAITNVPNVAIRTPYWGIEPVE